MPQASAALRSSLALLVAVALTLGACGADSSHARPRGQWRGIGSVRRDIRGAVAASAPRSIVSTTSSAALSRRRSSKPRPSAPTARHAGSQIRWRQFE